MDILVKHEGTTVTGDVISYEREHKICTGIGTLTIEFTRTTDRTFDPWDSIDIHENGDFKVRYYVSAVRDSVPDGKIVVDCQDLSKKLVDYFIPESYIIDYPSYTRYWIEFFLNMADVTYEFQTSSPGQLLSNYTQLGMMTVYEQLIILLQLSGWYMYFDGNGKAIIGPLNADLADETNSLGKDDIISIIVASDDKMLRNRALVLGAFDSYSLSYATADVTVKTRYNYDNNDIRTMVVYNSNIPNDASAYSIANVLLKEFARITVEKRIEAHGARDFTLGDACRVDSNVWRGKGLITTFGVRMDKNGLVSDIVLDERCPRLFGFFDYGDYVYVGTYGDGIWRKHIKFDPTWYNFSTGLTELRITDLHLNNGSFGSVGASGQMFLSTGAGWHPVTVTGLESSAANIVWSGNIVYSGFSPVMARATIVDKLSNNVKFGVDTWSGLNMGDYFLTLSGMFTSISFSGISITTGITISGAHRGWILEYNPYTQSIVGGLGSGIYPVHWSGYYNLIVLDLENDGYNDYVSVRLVGDGTNGLGKHENQPFGSMWDFRSSTSVPITRPFINSKGGNRRSGSTHGLIQASLYSDGLNRVVYVQRTDVGGPATYNLRESTYEATTDGNGDRVITVTDVNSVNVASVFEAVALRHVGLRIYEVYYVTTTGGDFKLFKRLWNAEFNNMGSEQEIFNFNMSPASRSLSGTVLNIDYQYLVLNDVLHILATQTYHAPSVGGQAFQATHLYVNLFKHSMGPGTTSNTELFHKATDKHEDHPEWSDYYFISYQVNNPVEPVISMMADRTSVKFFGWYGMDFLHFFNPIDAYRKVTDWVISGDDTGLTEEMIWEAENVVTIDFIANEAPPQTMFDRPGMDGNRTGFLRNGRVRQLSKNYSYMVVQSGTISDEGYWGFYWNGGDNYVLLTEEVENNFYQCPDRMFPLFIEGDYYIAKAFDDTYWLCSAASKTVITQIVAPTGYNLVKPISTEDSFSPLEYYWVVEDTTNFEYHLMAADATGLIQTKVTTLADIGTFDSESLQAVQIKGPFLVLEADNIDVEAGHDNIDIYFLDIEYMGGYMVLQREGSEYNLIERSNLPIRVDISNSTPVFTVTSGDDSFRSHYIYPESAETIYAATLTPFGSGRMVNDYRYTLLEPIPSGALPSGVGIGVEQMGLYISGSGIYGQNIRTYSGGWQPMFAVPSGGGTRIETSNFGLGGQYIFITASGFVQTFYQMDPGQALFTAYSGLPQSRATIIRLDDRI